MKREQEELSTEDKPMEKQPKHAEEDQEEESDNHEEVPDEEYVEKDQEGSDNNEEVPDEENVEEDHQEEVPAEEFLKAQLACEIYSALPAAAQRRLLVLCQNIFELGPSPDEWVRWKILTWAGNKWNANARGDGIELSSDGLTISRGEGAYMRAVRAVHAALPPIISRDPVQICYYETKFVSDIITIGFYCGNLDLNCNWLRWSPTWGVGMVCDNTMMFWMYGSWYPGKFQAGDVIGCGLQKHSGGNKRRVFFTKNGEFHASIPVQSDVADQLFPTIIVSNGQGTRLTDTNFGLKPFLFNYQGKEQMLLNGLGRDFEKET